MFSKKKIYVFVFFFIQISVLGCGGGGKDVFQITNFSPAEDALHVDPKKPQITVSFNREIDRDSISKSTFSVMRMQFHEKVQGEFIFDDTNPTVVTFEPAQPLQENEQYTVKITHNVTDKSFTHLANSKTWDFDTSAAAPTVNVFQPGEDDTGISTRTSIRVSFTNDISKSTVNNDSFYLHKDGGERVPGTISASGNDIILKPTTELLLGMKYHATVTTAIRDIHQNIVFATDKTWSFVTSNTRSVTTMVGGTEDDQVNDVVVDPEGNIYLVGSTASTLDNQTPLKAAPSTHSEFHGPATDILFAKYNSAGIKQWLKIVGTDQPDNATNALFDNTGGTGASLYIAGTTSGQLEGTPKTTTPSDGFAIDLFVIKVDAATANVLWKKQIRMDGHLQIGGLAKDANGNIYVVGSADLMKPPTDVGVAPTPGSPPPPPMFFPRHPLMIAKLDPSSGNILKQQVNDNKYDELIHDVRITPNGSLVVTGMRAEVKPDAGFTTSSDAFYAFYDTNSLTETNVVLMKTQGVDIANSISVDNVGNVFLAGSTHSDPITSAPLPNENAFLAKYNANGIQEWIKKWGTEEMDGAHFVRLDAQGNPVVATISFIPNPYLGIPPPPPMPGIPMPPQPTGGQMVSSVFVYKFNAVDGSTLWNPAKRIAADNHVDASGFFIDAVGNIFVSGNTHGSIDGNTNNGNEDGFFTKFDANGAQQ